MTTIQKLLPLFLVAVVNSLSISAQNNSYHIEGKLISTSELFNDIQILTSDDEIGFSKTHTLGFEDLLLLPKSAQIFSDKIILDSLSTIYLISLETKTSEKIFNQAVVKNLGEIVLWQRTSNKTIHYIKYIPAHLEVKDLNDHGELVLNYFENKYNVRFFSVHSVQNIKLKDKLE